MTVSIPATDEPTPVTDVAPAQDDSVAGVSRFVVVLAVTGTILLALGAFWLSFTTLRDLAVLSGVPAEQAWIWPLIVDGVILEATISVVALRNSAPAARRFAWLLLAAGPEYPSPRTSPTRSSLLTLVSRRSSPPWLLRCRRWYCWR